MFENKENGDTETWADIEENFFEAYHFWLYELNKSDLSVDFIESVQKVFLDCQCILRQREGARDYVQFSQGIELLRVFFFSSESTGKIYARALKEIVPK